MTSKVIKCLEQYFWKKIPNLESRKGEIFIDCSGQASSQDDLRNLCLNIKDERLPADFVQWRVHVFPDYTETKSAYIVQCHGSVLPLVKRIFKDANPPDTKSPDDASKAEDDKWPEQRDGYKNLKRVKGL